MSSLELTVYNSKEDNFHPIRSNQTEPIRILKERIADRFEWDQFSLDLRMYEGGRDLNQDEKTVGQMGITQDTFLLVRMNKEDQGSTTTPAQSFPKKGSSVLE